MNLHLRITGLLMLLAAATPAVAQQQEVHNAKQQPVISIIIDDLGNQHRSGLRAIDLPGKLTYAILPDRPYTRLLADYAYRQHKEVMVHMPMEAINGRALGAGGLTECMHEQQFKNQVRKNFNAVPHAVGFNNHMGSLLTASPTMMRWLMQAAMFHDNFYFVDSRTTSDTVAFKNASQRGIRSTSRDIFLDYDAGPEVVVDQLAKLVHRAKRTGSALAIGHPHPATLAILEQWLPYLQQQGVRLVPVSELIAIRQHRRDSSWPMYSSR
jgi:polysaccharide deacetylase 2 family uncharacterized protein YibQ